MARGEIDTELGTPELWDQREPLRAQCIHNIQLKLVHRFRRELSI